MRILWFANRASIRIHRTNLNLKSADLGWVRGWNRSEAVACFGVHIKEATI